MMILQRDQQKNRPIMLTGRKMVSRIHWAVHTCRGLVAFLAFMNLGTAARCFTDEGFLSKKIFNAMNQPQTNKHISKVNPEMTRLFGCWSILNSIIFFHCAIYLRSVGTIPILICSLLLYLGYFLSECVYFKTGSVFGSAMFPIAISALTLVWLSISITRKYLWRTVEPPEIDEEQLMKKKIPIAKSSKKHKMA